MNFATVVRMARLCGQPLASLAFFHCRTAMGILVVSSAFLLNTHAAFAQREIGPAATPWEAIVPRLVPLQGETVDTEAMANMPSALIHEIIAGDTLTNVAQRYHVEPADLATYNQILDYNNVIIGQKLRIPPVGVTITEPAVVTVPGADGYHVVRIGESLNAIARQYNLTLEELMALNDIDEPNIVQMGMMLRLTEDVEAPKEAMQPKLEALTYRVQRGDSLVGIAQAYHTTAVQILKDNELAVDANLKVGQTLRILPPATAMEAFGVDAPLNGERMILIDLSEQTLTAYQGDVVVLESIVSTGKASTPTKSGEYATYIKYDSQHMSGDDYDLPGVPWVMYYDDEYAIHGAYWHANFGIPTSHGCTNMTISESKALYSWAPTGTRVVVQE